MLEHTSASLAVARRERNTRTPIIQLIRDGLKAITNLSIIYFDRLIVTAAATVKASSPILSLLSCITISSTSTTQKYEPTFFLGFSRS
jgi:hypothetical protein